MRRVTVRDLRQRWPEVERMLEREGEIEITRDGKTVARLLRRKPASRERGHFDADGHLHRLRRRFGNRVMNVVDAALAEEREDD